MGDFAWARSSTHFASSSHFFLYRAHFRDAPWLRARLLLCSVLCACASRFAGMFFNIAASSDSARMPMFRTGYGRSHQARDFLTQTSQYTFQVVALMPPRRQFQYDSQPPSPARHGPLPSSALPSRTSQNSRSPLAITLSSAARRLGVSSNAR